MRECTSEKFTVAAPHEVHALVQESFGKFARPEHGALFTAEFFELASENGTFLGVREAGKLVGAIHFQRIDSPASSAFCDEEHPSTDRDRAFYFLSSLAVDPQYQGRGIASTLFKEALQRIQMEEQASDSVEVRTCVAVDQAKASIRICESNDFTPYYTVDVPGWGKRYTLGNSSVRARFRINPTEIRV